MAGGFDEGMSLGYEDWEFWLRATKAGFNVTSIEDTLFFYRKRGDSMFTNAKKNHVQIINYMKTKHPINELKKWKH